MLLKKVSSTRKNRRLVWPVRLLQRPEPEEPPPPEPEKESEIDVVLNILLHGLEDLFFFPVDVLVYMQGGIPPETVKNEYAAPRERRIYRI